MDAPDDATVFATAWAFLGVHRRVGFHPTATLGASERFKPRLEGHPTR